MNILTSEVLDPVKSPDIETDFPSDDSRSYSFEKIVEKGNLKDECNPNQLRELEILLDEFQEMFLNDPGLTDLTEHDIELSKNKIMVRT